ncbi:DUF998 domain-containing protein [Nocardia sp. NPDC058058]|uniref:DUF998 domain-containing protein n=1 Tax=Nocardia sp. NPDC058058 TaxID=3346317 RepID=UPI0036DD3C41
MTDAPLDRPGPDRIGRLGALAWVSIIQYFVFLFVVQARWTTPYSWIRNAISDLGATTCFRSDSVEAWVCSPWHRVANVSWVIAGACMTIGALALYRLFPRNKLSHIGSGLYAVAGIGLIVVGLNPEDADSHLHGIGAVIAIAGGIAAMLCLSIALRRAGQWLPVARTGIVLGVAAICGFIVMAARVGGPARFGLWERIAAFPVLIWLILCGAYLLLGARGAAAVSE